MKRQQWIVTRCQVSHPAAERRWDQAYQLLLSAPAAAGPGVPEANTPTGTPEEDRHACSRLRPGINHASGSGPND